MNTVKVIFVVILCTFAYFAILISIGLLHKKPVAKPEIYSGPEIHLAASGGNLAKVESLLSQDKELINALDKYGDTPLQLAAFKGYAEIVEYLISRGADVNNKNNFGGTALYMASYAGHEQVVEILIEHRVDVNVAMKNNREQVLQVATMEGYRDYSHMYDALGGSINRKVHFIGSPLQAAAANPPWL